MRAMAAKAAPPLVITTVDGRRRRSERSRDSIVGAMIDLVGGGAITPSAEEVAARAGVGLRSVFRHFRDMESLFSAMRRQLASDYELWLVPYASRDWRGQLGELTDRRLTTYERLLPFMRASDVHRHRSSTLEDEHRRIRSIIRARLQMVLAAGSIVDPVDVEALDMLLSPETWQRLRTEQHLDAMLARTVIQRLVDRALADAVDGDARLPLRSSTENVDHRARDVANVA